MAEYADAKCNSDGHRSRKEDGLLRHMELRLADALVGLFSFRLTAERLLELLEESYLTPGLKPAGRVTRISSEEVHSIP
jgi:hypothetical protein